MKYNDIDLNLYKIFLAVADCKSFSKAANNLHITQPAVSYAIKTLEENLNAKLFIRNYNQSILTKEGEILISHIKKAYNNILVGEKFLQDSHNLIFGDINIGVPTHIGTTLVMPKICEFHKFHPNIKFHILSKSTNSMISLLENNSLDFIIDSFPIENTNRITLVNLNRSKTCFVSKNNLNESITENNYMNFDFILPNKSTSNRLMFDELLSKQEITIFPSVESYSTEMAVQFVKEDFGIAWLLKDSIQYQLDNKMLYEVPTTFKLPEIQLQLAYIDNFISFPARKFIEKYFIKNQS